MSQSIEFWVCHPLGIPEEAKADYLLDASLDSMDEDETFRSWLNSYPQNTEKPEPAAKSYDWTKMKVTVEVAP